MLRPSRSGLEIEQGISPTTPLKVMAVPKRKYRELVFQLIYSYDLNDQLSLEKIYSLLDYLMVTKRTIREAFHHMMEVMRFLSTIDAVIGRASSEYRIERISCVEKNILRLGVFEILYDDEIPFKVVLSEAVRLARKFGTPESSAFVHGVLDGVYHHCCRHESEAEKDAVNITKS